MIITISREYGSGGSQIGHMVADKLAIPCYDKTVSELTACIAGLSGSVVHNSQDKYSSGLAHLQGYDYGLYSRNIFLPIYDQIFFAQSKAIVQLAQKGDCVLVGRCSSHILQFEGIKCFNVFVYAPAADRIKRIMEKDNLNEVQAVKLMKKNDRARSNYYQKYAEMEWGKMQNYHAAISSSIGVENAVEAIIGLAKVFFEG